MKIKIAHLTTVDISLRYLLLNQLLYLKNQGFQVYGISSAGTHVGEIENAGIHHIPVPISRKLFSPLKDITSLLKMIKIFRRERFTIIHVHTPKASFLGQIAANLSGTPIIIRTIHGFYFHQQTHPIIRRILIWMERYAGQFADIVLSQNREDITTAIEEKIFPATKVKHLGNGIDLDLFNPKNIDSVIVEQLRNKLNIDQNFHVIGFVGRLAAYRKGFIYFLYATQRILEKYPNTRFLVIGSPDEGKSDAIKPGIMEEFNNSDNYIFLGQLNNCEMPIYYSLMDIHVLPSLFEGIPRAVIEASAMGVPSIVTDVKGNREVIEEKRNGLLVPYGDDLILAEKIMFLLENPDICKKMGALGIDMANDRFNEKVMFERVLQTYKYLLSKEQTKKQSG